MSGESNQTIGSRRSDASVTRVPRTRFRRDRVRPDALSDASRRGRRPRGLPRRGIVIIRATHRVVVHPPRRRGWASRRAPCRRRRAPRRFVFRSFAPARSPCLPLRAALRVRARPCRERVVVRFLMPQRVQIDGPFRTELLGPVRSRAIRAVRRLVPFDAADVAAVDGRPGGSPELVVLFHTRRSRNEARGDTNTFCDRARDATSPMPPHPRAVNSDRGLDSSQKISRSGANPRNGVVPRFGAPALVTTPSCAVRPATRMSRLA